MLNSKLSLMCRRPIKSLKYHLLSSTESDSDVFLPLKGGGVKKNVYGVFVDIFV